MTGADSHLPRRPPRGGRPAVAPPVLQPPGLPARAAAERRRRHHRPRGGGTRRTAAGARGAGRRLARRVPARRGHRHRPRRGRHPRGARDDRRVDQARRARAGPRELPGPVRHRAAVLLPGHRRDPGDHAAGRQRRDLAVGRPRRRHVCRVAGARAARRARHRRRDPAPRQRRGAAVGRRSWSGWPRRSPPTCGSTSSSRRPRGRCPSPGGPSRGRTARPRPVGPRPPGGASGVLGFTPLDVVDLSDPAAGVRGQAFVLPHSSAARGTLPALRQADAGRRGGARRAARVGLLRAGGARHRRPRAHGLARVAARRRGAARDPGAPGRAAQALAAADGAHRPGPRRGLLPGAPPRGQGGGHHRRRHARRGGRAAALGDHPGHDDARRVQRPSTGCSPTSTGSRTTSRSPRSPGPRTSRCSTPATPTTGCCSTAGCGTRPGSSRAGWSPSTSPTGSRRRPPPRRPAFAPLLDVARSVLGRARAVPVVRSFRPESLQAVLLVGRDADRERDRLEVAEAAQRAVGRRARHPRRAGCRAALRAQRRQPRRCGGSPTPATPPCSGWRSRRCTATPCSPGGIRSPRSTARWWPARCRRSSTGPSTEEPA